MSKVEESRLYAWNSNLEKRATVVRHRRSQLEEKKGVCIQLEASLIELANENDATERLLVQKERYMASRKAALEEANKQRNIRRTFLDGEKRKAAIKFEHIDNALDNEWRLLEEEVAATELDHHQRMNRLQQQLEQLSKQEDELVEKIRQVNDAELRITNQLRQLKQKEDQLKSLAEATLQQMKNELRERESLVNQ
ncbi:uncharacterized protein TM35_000041960 [Trypanosoma theileri]|uniref:Uncharacterized protein n=1 Tax=Trypanosoma theileri TaxID=67003 RepID=A0A1X0P4Y0_9TRYP|nr:uncharacterized protein TM35_000041960 [Trypanosoma theileri]ORC91982.1 hypothetical protein TM35_000041960 [Trypanosoma theileri]